MHFLEHSEVLRSGRSTRYLTKEGTKIWASSTKDSWGKNLVRLDFSIASKGGGTTNVFIDIDPRDFEDIVDCFVNCDRNSMLPVLIKFTGKLLAEENERLKNINKDD